MSLGYDFKHTYTHFGHQEHFATQNIKINSQMLGVSAAANHSTI